MVSSSLADSPEIMKPNCLGINLLRALFALREKSIRLFSSNSAPFAKKRGGAYPCPAWCDVRCIFRRVPVDVGAQHAAPFLPGFQPCRSIEVARRTRPQPPEPTPLQCRVPKSDHP